MNSSSHSRSRPTSKDIYLGKDLNRVAKSSDKTTRSQLEQYRWFLRFSGTIPKEVIDIADSDDPDCPPGPSSRIKSQVVKVPAKVKDTTGSSDDPDCLPGPSSRIRSEVVKVPAKVKDTTGSSDSESRPLKQKSGTDPSNCLPGPSKSSKTRKEVVKLPAKTQDTTGSDTSSDNDYIKFLARKKRRQLRKRKREARRSSSKNPTESRDFKKTLDRCSAINKAVAAALDSNTSEFITESDEEQQQDDSRMNTCPRKRPTRKVKKSNALCWVVSAAQDFDMVNFMAEMLQTGRVPDKKRDIIRCRAIISAHINSSREPSAMKAIWKYYDEVMPAWKPPVNKGKLFQLRELKRLTSGAQDDTKVAAKDLKVQKDTAKEPKSVASIGSQTDWTMAARFSACKAAKYDPQHTLPYDGPITNTQEDYLSLLRHSGDEGEQETPRTLNRKSKNKKKRRKENKGGQ